MPFPGTFPSTFLNGGGVSSGYPNLYADSYGVGTDLSYDAPSYSYDDAGLTYDGGTPSTEPPPPLPPPDGEFQLDYSPPFGTSELYVVETRTIGGDRVAILPHQNLQMEFLLNEPGNCRFNLDIHHRKVTRNNIEELVHEVWVWRDGSLIYAGPVWEISTNSDGSALNVTSQGLLSWFRKRVIDAKMLWITTNTGPGIANYLINWTQAKAHGNLRITTEPSGLNLAATTPGVALGYKQSYHWWERKVIYDAINDLGDNVATGFDYEITPQRVFKTYSPSRTGDIPGSLKYPVNVTSYYLPRYGSRVVNDMAYIGPGDGEATLVGYAASVPSMSKYGLMQGTESWGDAKTKVSLTSKAQKYLAEHKATTAVPNITMHTNIGPFIYSYQPGNSLKVVIDNGYDQFNKLVRMTGYQLTAGANDQETVNVYLDMEEASV